MSINMQEFEEVKDEAETTGVMPTHCPLCGQFLHYFDLRAFKGGQLIKCLCGFKTSRYAASRAPKKFILNRISLGKYDKEPPF